MTSFAPEFATIFSDPAVNTSTPYKPPGYPYMLAMAQNTFPSIVPPYLEYEVDGITPKTSTQTAIPASDFDAAWATWQGLAAPSQWDADSAYLQLDLEHWWNFPFIDGQKLRDTLALVRDAAIKAKAVSGGMPVTLYNWGPASSIVFIKQGRQAEMRAANDIVAQELASHVDLWTPKLYMTYKGANPTAQQAEEDAWVQWAQFQISEARRISPSRPIKPYIWFEYDPAGDAGGQKLSRETFRLMMDTIYNAGADGFVIWGNDTSWGGGGAAPWDDNAPWYLEFLDFMQAIQINNTPSQPPSAVAEWMLRTTDQPIDVPSTFPGYHRSLQKPKNSPTDPTVLVPDPPFDLHALRTMKAEADGEYEVCFWRSCYVSPGVYDFTRARLWADRHPGVPIVWTLYGTPLSLQKYVSDYGPNAGNPEPSKWNSWPGIASPPADGSISELVAFRDAVIAEFGVWGVGNGRIMAFEFWNESRVPWTGGSTSYTDRMSEQWHVDNFPGRQPFWSGTATDYANCVWALAQNKQGVPLWCGGFQDVNAVDTDILRFFNAPVTVGGSGNIKTLVDGFSFHGYHYAHDPAQYLARMDTYISKRDAIVPGMPMYNTEIGGNEGGNFVDGDPRIGEQVMSWALMTLGRRVQGMYLYGIISQPDATTYLANPSNSQTSQFLGYVNQLRGVRLIQIARLQNGKMWAETNTGLVFESGKAPEQKAGGKVSTFMTTPQLLADHCVGPVVDMEHMGFPEGPPGVENWGPNHGGWVNDLPNNQVGGFQNSAGQNRQVVWTTHLGPETGRGDWSNIKGQMRMGYIYLRRRADKVWELQQKLPNPWNVIPPEQPQEHQLRGELSEPQRVMTSVVAAASGGSFFEKLDNWAPHQYPGELLDIDFNKYDASCFMVQSRIWPKDLTLPFDENLNKVGLYIGKDNYNSLNYIAEANHSAVQRMRLRWNVHCSANVYRDIGRVPAYDKYQQPAIGFGSISEADFVANPPPMPDEQEIWFEQGQYDEANDRQTIVLHRSAEAVNARTYNLTRHAGTLTVPSSVVMPAGSSSVAITMDAPGGQVSDWQAITAVAAGDPLEDAYFGGTLGDGTAQGGGGEPTTVVEPTVTGTAEVGSVITGVYGSGYAVARRYWEMDGARLCQVNSSRQLGLALYHTWHDIRLVEEEPNGTKHRSSVVQVRQPAGTPIDQVIPETDRYELVANEDWSDGNLARINADGTLPSGSQLSYFDKKFWSRSVRVNRERQRFTAVGDTGSADNPFPSPNQWQPFSINTTENYLAIFARRAFASETPHLDGADWLSGMIRSTFALRHYALEMDWLTPAEGWSAAWTMPEPMYVPDERDLGEVGNINQASSTHQNRHLQGLIAQGDADPNYYSDQDNPNGTGWISNPDGRTNAGNIHTVAHIKPYAGDETALIDGRVTDSYADTNRYDPDQCLVTLSVPPDDSDFMTPVPPSTTNLELRCYGIRWWQRPSEAVDQFPVANNQPTINTRNARPGDVLTATDATWADQGNLTIERWFQISAYRDKLSLNQATYQTEILRNNFTVFRIEEATHNTTGRKTRIASEFTWVSDGNQVNPNEGGEPPGNTDAVNVVAENIDIAAIIATAQAQPQGTQKANYANAIIAALGTVFIELLREGVAYYRDATGALTVNSNGDIVVPMQFDEPAELNQVADIQSGTHVLHLYNGSAVTTRLVIPLGPPGTSDAFILSDDTDGTRPVRTQNIVLRSPASLDTGAGGVDVQLERAIAMVSQPNAFDIPDMSGVEGSPRWAKPLSEMGIDGHLAHGCMAMHNAGWSRLPPSIRNSLTAQGFDNFTQWPSLRGVVRIFGGASNAATNAAISAGDFEFWGMRRSDKKWERINASKTDVAERVGKPSGQLVVSDWSSSLRTIGDRVECELGSATELGQTGIQLSQGVPVDITPSRYEFFAFGVQLRLVLWNTAGTNDLAAAQVMAHVAAEWVPNFGTFDPGQNPGMGNSAAFQISSNDQWFMYLPAATLCGAYDPLTLSQLRNNPPPFGTTP